MQGYPGFSGSAPTFTSFPGSFPSSTGFAGSAPFGSSFGGSSAPFGFAQSSFGGFPSSSFGATPQFAGFANNFSNALTAATPNQSQFNFFNQTPQFGGASSFSQPTFGGQFGAPVGQSALPGSAINFNTPAPQAGQAPAGGNVRGLPAAGSNMPFNLDSLNMPGSAMNSNFQNFQGGFGGFQGGLQNSGMSVPGSAMNVPGSAMNSLALPNFGGPSFGSGSLPPAGGGAVGFPSPGAFGGGPSGAPLQGGFDFQQMMLQQQAMAAAAMGQGPTTGAQEYWEVQVPGTTDKWNRFPVASATELAQANAQGTQGTMKVADDTGAEWVVNVMARTAVSAADPSVSTLVKRTEVSAPAGAE